MQANMSKQEATKISVIVAVRVVLLHSIKKNEDRPSGNEKRAACNPGNNKTNC